MEKLQSDFAVPQTELKEMAKGILGDLGILPGTESTLKYGQVSQISGRIRAAGGRYRQQNPVPQARDIPLPKVAGQLPQELQNDVSLAHTFAALSKDRLLNRDDFLHFHQRLGKNAVSNDQFRYQLQVFRWLESSRKFSRDDFVNVCNRDYVIQGFLTNC